MRLLTPFEFIQMFPEGKSLCIVGNAPSIKGQQLGSWIDSHDIVVRFNACSVRDHKEDVGSRTTILVTNPYPEGREKPEMLGVENHTILVINPQTRRGNLNEFEQWAGNANVLFTYTSDLVGIKDTDHKAGFTMGTYAVYLLPRILCPSSVSITGFTMFLGNTFFHYWSFLRPKGLAAHDVEREAQIFINICNNIRCPVEVTEDIEWIAKKTKITLRKKHMNIRKLPDGEWCK